MSTIHYAPVPCERFPAGTICARYATIAATLSDGRTIPLCRTCTERASARELVTATVESPDTASFGATWAAIRASARVAAEAA